MSKELEEKKAERQILQSNANHDDSEKQRYEAIVDDKSLKFPEAEVTAEEILQKAGYKPAGCYTLYQKFKDCDFERISSNEKVNLAKPGLERFTVKDTDVFRYTLDDEPETSDQKHMTANEILAAGGMNPTDYYLVEILGNHKQKSYRNNPTESIRLTCPGNKFISVFKGETPVS